MRSTTLAAACLYMAEFIVGLVLLTDHSHHKSACTSLWNYVLVKTVMWGLATFTLFVREEDRRASLSEQALAICIGTGFDVVWGSMIVSDLQRHPSCDHGLAIRPLIIFFYVAWIQSVIEISVIILKQVFLMWYAYDQQVMASQVRKHGEPLDATLAQLNIILAQMPDPVQAPAAGQQPINTRAIITNDPA